MEFQQAIRLVLELSLVSRKEARSFQTWSIAGFVAAHGLLAQPQHLELFGDEESPAVMACSLRGADES